MGKVLPIETAALQMRNYSLPLAFPASQIPVRVSLVLQLWARADTGMLISERLVNCPPQLAPPLHQALFEEVAWATEDEPSQVPLTLRPKLEHVEKNI